MKLEVVISLADERGRSEMCEFFQEWTSYKRALTPYASFDECAEIFQRMTNGEEELNAAYVCSVLGQIVHDQVLQHSSTSPLSKALQLCKVMQFSTDYSGAEPIWYLMSVPMVPGWTVMASSDDVDTSPIWDALKEASVVRKVVADTLGMFDMPPNNMVN